MKCAKYCIIIYSIFSMSINSIVFILISINTFNCKIYFHRKMFNATEISIEFALSNTTYKWVSIFSSVCIKSCQYFDTEEKSRTNCVKNKWIYITFNWYLIGIKAWWSVHKKVKCSSEGAKCRMLSSWTA